jgi:hypothetical protein
MLGTAWATAARSSGKLKWLGGAEPSAASSCASSVASGGSGASRAAPKPKKAAPAPAPPKAIQAKADHAAEVIECAGEIKVVLGEMVLVRKNQAAYAMALDASGDFTAGAYLGRYNPDTDEIDATVSEAACDGDEE